MSIWERIACTVCLESFTEEQWYDRHDDLDGGDVHAECCPICSHIRKHLPEQTTTTNKGDQT
jgi:hypothetical protein